MPNTLKAILFILISLALFVSSGYCKAESENQTKSNNSQGPKIESQLISPEKIKEDLANLYRGLQSGHYNLYVNLSKEEYDAAYKRLIKQVIQPMTKLDIQIMFLKFVALGKIAHAKIDLPVSDYRAFREKGGKTFPLYVKTLNNKVYVTESYAKSTIVLGSQIVSINHEPINEFLRGLRQFLSADTDIMANGFIEFYLPILMWLEYGEQDSYQVELVSPSGKRTNSRIESVTQIEMEAANQETEGGNVQYLQLGMERTARMLDSGIAYLRPGPFYNTDVKAKDVWDAKTFNKFINESIEQFNQHKARALIIDLRNNPGGNNSFSDHLIQKFATKEFSFTSSFSVKVSPEAINANNQRLDINPSDKISFSAKIAKEYHKREAGDIFEYPIEKTQPKRVFTKPVYVLINRHSYSNAVLVAAIIQDYNLGKIIGEETSDLATTYGAMEHFVLSHSKLKVGFPKAFIIRPSGDDSIRGVVPDIAIKTPILESANDPVLQRTLELVIDLLN